MSFSSGIGGFRLKIQTDNEKFRRAVVLKLFSSIIKDTPVDTGRARANWQTSIAAPVLTQSASTDKTGATAIANAQSAITSSKWGDTLYFTNNLPYIHKLEFGGYPNPAKTGSKTIGGYSKKAPAGMFRRNVARINAILSAARL